MKEIKLVIPEQGEKLSVNVGDIHKELLKLPAEIYVDLYHMMKSKMENGYLGITADVIRSGAILG